MKNRVCITLLILFSFLPYGLAHGKDAKSGIPLSELKAPQTALDQLVLIGTIIRKDRASTAIIKNLDTDELEAYLEGEVIDIVESGEVKLKKVRSCLVVIEYTGLVETLKCRKEFNSLNQEESDSSKPGKVSSPPIKVKDVMSPTQYDRYIQKAAAKYGIDPDLVRAIIKVESNFNPKAVSPRNAMGIMQLMPEVAKDYGVIDLFDPVENIEGGVRFLRDLIEFFNGNLLHVLSAYNAGKRPVISSGFRVPNYSETMDYVRKVLVHYSFLKEGKK